MYAPVLDLWGVVPILCKKRGCLICASGFTTVGCGYGGNRGLWYGKWVLKGASNTETGLLQRPSVVRPADLWNLDILLTTCGVACVLTPTLPPYGVMGKTWLVPRNVDTVAHRESGEKLMSWTLAVVSPLWRMYKWWTAAKVGPPGWGWMRNRWKSCPRLSAVNRRRPLGSNLRQTMASVCAAKWATTASGWMVFSVLSMLSLYKKSGIQQIFTFDNEVFKNLRLDM